MQRMFFTGCLTLSLAGAGCSMLLTQPIDPAALAMRTGDYWPLKAGAVWVMKPFGRSLPESGDDFKSYSIGSSTVSITSVEMASNAMIARASSVTRHMALYGLVVGNEPSLPYSDQSSSLDLIKEASGKVQLSAASGSALVLPGNADRYRFSLYEEARRFTDASFVVFSVPYLQVPREVGDVSLAPPSIVEGSPPYRFSDVRQTTTVVPEVVVSAGRFTNCLKLVVTSTTQREVENDRSRSTLRTFETIYWLAEGVGIIKKQLTISPGTGGTPDAFEEELAAYSIPHQP